MLLRPTIFGLLVLALGGVAAAERPEPRSLRVMMRNALVREAPDRTARVIGTLVRNVRLPYRGQEEGPGCDGPWYRLDPSGWVCREVVLPTDRPAELPDLLAVPDGKVLPYRYAFTRVDDARLFMRSSDALDGEPHRVLGRGFGFGLRRAVMRGGRLLWRARNGRYVLQDEIWLARPTRFAGLGIPKGERPDLAWTFRRNAPIQAEAGEWGRWRAIASLDAHTRVRVLEARTIEDTEWLRVAFEPRRRHRRAPVVGEGWVAERYVRRVGYAPRPEGIGLKDRWIDVDRNRQTLVAYHGDVPVYATMVSTGRRLGSTPAGIHRVREKHAWTTMDNLENPDSEHPYAFEDVPWVQYFHRSIALHAALWHEAFGYRMSHGCVNLAPQDARFLYGWTALRVPLGWSSRRATDELPGTVVRVR